MSGAGRGGHCRLPQGAAAGSWGQGWTQDCVELSQLGGPGRLQGAVPASTARDACGHVAATRGRHSTSQSSSSGPGTGQQAHPTCLLPAPARSRGSADTNPSHHSPGPVPLHSPRSPACLCTRVLPTPKAQHPSRAGPGNHTTRDTTAAVSRGLGTSGQESGTVTVPREALCTGRQEPGGPTTMECPAARCPQQWDAQQCPAARKHPGMGLTS